MSSPADPLIGAVLAGRYAIERRLGMGGMGAVYLARQQSLGRPVALKVLRGELVSDPVSVERFKNEARVIAQLGHPHIVGIHDFGTTDDGMLFIAMEYLAGRTLAEAIRESGTLPWARTLHILRDITRALAAAHRRDVVHRDLKPENVLLVEAEGMCDFVKVLDFGIAKLVKGHEVASNLTGTGLVPGTPGYIAPEQITGSNDDPRSDLYAVGVTWFEMLTGHRPFEAQSAMKIFLAQLEGEAPRVDTVHPQLKLPPEVDELLMSLLAREPDKRPSSAEELLARLRKLEDRGVAAPTPQVQTPPAGTLTVDSLEPLHPDAPTMPATTTPSTPVPTRTTPSTGTTPAGRLVTREEQRATQRKWAARWAAAGVVMVALAALAIAGWRDGGLTDLLASRMPLPVASSDDGVRVELTNALEAFYDGELDVANRAVEKVLRSSQDEPGAWVMKVALATRANDYFAEGQALGRLSSLLASGLPRSCATDEELLQAVVRAAAGDRDDVRAAWDACGSCRDTGLAGLFFAGFAADAHSRDPELGIRAADHALSHLPAAALPYADKARFLIEQGVLDGDGGATKVLEAGLAKNPESPLLHQTMAEVLLARGLYERAEDELRIALSMSTSPEATMLLAHTLLLQGDEEGRKTVVDLAQRTSTPQVLSHFTTHHGAALIGAGRVTEAIALYEDALDAALKSGTRAELASAALLSMEALRAADAAGAAADAGGLYEAIDRLLKHVATPIEQTVILRWVLGLVSGALAADSGNQALAVARLTDLINAPPDALPAQARKGIVGYLAYRVYVSDAARLEEAEAALEELQHPCSKLEASARVAAKRQDDVLARARWQALIEREPYCRLSTYGGAHSMNARAAIIALDVKEGHVDEAKRGLEELEKHYPKADKDLPALRLARSVIPAQIEEAGAAAKP